MGILQQSRTKNSGSGNSAISAVAIPPAPVDSNGFYTTTALGGASPLRPPVSSVKDSRGAVNRSIISDGPLTSNKVLKSNIPKLSRLDHFHQKQPRAALNFIDMVLRCTSVCMCKGFGHNNFISFTLLSY